MAKLSEIAARVNREPYDLDLEDGGAVILVAQPTIGQWQEAITAPTAGGFLAGLGASEADAARLDKLMDGQGLGTEGALVTAVRRHFGLKN
jgi:hypothetical protein